MTDIVRIFEDIATAKGYGFAFGKKATLNLLQPQSVEPDKIYLLHEFCEREGVQNANRTRLTSTMFNGKFFLVKLSNLDQGYEGKYEQHIEPLLDIFNELGNYFGCGDNTVHLWKNIDVTDALDANMDGLLVTYKIEVPV